jgi:hypothetical protein
MLILLKGESCLFSLPPFFVLLRDFTPLCSLFHEWSVILTRRFDTLQVVVVLVELQETRRFHSGESSMFDRTFHEEPQI